jgi:3-oxoacyl-[acyl-carrier protein] reductase
MTSITKTALVTGASRGLGAAIATELSQQGFTVVGTATTADGAAQITSRLAEQGFTGCGVVMDVADQTSIDNAISEVTANYGAPLILVNNAGITRDNLLLRMSIDEWTDVIKTNLDSIYRLSKASLKAMLKARWGRIINISSIVGVTGNPGQANYSAAKAGIIGFSKSLAQEIASRNITVNVIAPGFIDTDMTRALSDEQKQNLLAQIPMQRLGTTEDIAKAVVFLVSDGAAYITGQTLHVNGGMYMV